jgi:hypothetical protein
MVRFHPEVEKKVIIMALFMAILATIVGLLTALYIFVDNAGDVDDKNFEKNLKISLVKAIATVTIMYIAANFTVYSWTGNSKISEREKDMTLAEATASYGLKSDTEYPFDIGNRITGTAGSTTTGGSYFYLYNKSSWSPASSLSVGFTANGKSYIFEIPMSHITFIQSEVAQPSMKMHMDYPLPAGKYTIRDTYSACKKRIKYGWWTCENHHLKTETTAVVNGELPSLIQTAFSKFSDTHVTITLTPEQYNLLLTGGNPAPSS